LIGWPHTLEEIERRLGAIIAALQRRHQPKTGGAGCGAVATAVLDSRR
jgi:hypothetical protein